MNKLKFKLLFWILDILKPLERRYQNKKDNTRLVYINHDTEEPTLLGTVTSVSWTMVFFARLLGIERELLKFVAVAKRPGGVKRVSVAKFLFSIKG